MADRFDPQRLKFERLMPDRCTVVRPTRTKDTAGGWTESDATIASGVPCRVDTRDRTANIPFVAGGVQTVAPYVVTMSVHPSRWPSGVVDITDKDTLIVTGQGAGSFQVLAPGGPTTGELTREVPCTRRQGG